MKRLHLNRREKYAVTAAVACLVVLLLFQLVIFPLADSRKRLHRVAAQKEMNLSEIQALQAEYQSLQRQADRARASIAKREAGFSLFSFLDRLVGQTGIRENVTYMKPSTTVQKDTNVKLSIVEFKLRAVTTEQIMNLLYQVEHSDNHLVVKRASISETGKPEGFVDVVLQVETIES